MNEPLITVVIPVFNEEDRVGRAIDSMRLQTYKNLEIIVVDDGSTDRSAQMVKEIAAKDDRVSYHLLPVSNERKTNWRGYDINAGYKARAYGFSLAKGEWVTTQDADDASVRNRIQVQYEFARDHKATLVTVSWMQCKAERVGTLLDVQRITEEKGLDSIVITPESIRTQALQNRGILMREPLHQYLPFPFKWFPYTRRLFFRGTDPYPGADNCMLFHRSVLEDGITFRHRNRRTWATPSGRGSGRDFAYRVAATYGNSWSLTLPMYLWDVNIENESYAGYDAYLSNS